MGSGASMQMKKVTNLILLELDCADWLCIILLGNKDLILPFAGESGELDSRSSSLKLDEDVQFHN